MADTNNEIKKTITIDLGNTATKLKDYKKHIDDLRGSLLQLDKNSEDYRDISKEIEVEQNKLNEVMQVGKKTTDAADGSYNKLTQTMAELKKQWKTTGDEVERAELGKKILSINNQLKDLDASTGNFQRNVGDYTNAFEAAFGKVLDGIIKIDGPIGEVGGTVKNMIPVIKNVNKTAVAGLTGVKKAIAATGIGLLVIAVAELIAHWKDLTAIIGVSENDISDFKDKAIDAFKNIVAGAVGVGNAIGNFLLAPIKSTIEAFKGLGNIIKDVFTGEFSKIKDDATAAFNAITAIGTKAIDFKGNYQKGVEAADNLIVKIENRLAKGGEESGTKFAENFKKGVENKTKREPLDIIDIDSKTFEDKLELTFKEAAKIIKEKKSRLKDDLAQEQFEFSLISDSKTEQETIDAVFAMESDYINKLILLNEELLQNTTATEEEKRALIYETDQLRQELANKQAKYAKDTADNEIKEAKRSADFKKKEQQALLSATQNLFGALSDLSEEGSEEQKAFSIMQTIINTLQAIMATWAGFADMGAFGVAAAVAQTAAITATGAATIAKMKSTTKETASSASVAAPQITTPSMTSVSPLLDDTADINRLETSGIKGYQSQQPIKCYVVESDITDIHNKVQVVEDNATF